MPTLKLAVFGHYDSRGGTTAIRLPEFTEAAVYEAMKKYDTEVFCIDSNDPDFDIGSTSYGMPARECDKIAHKMIYGDMLPSHQDFLYAAELHYDGELPDADLDNGNRKVLIDASTEPGEDGSFDTLAKPVQLEFVELPEGFDADITAIEKELDAEAERVGVWVSGFDSAWTTEQWKEHKRLHKAAEALKVIRNIHIRVMAKVLKGDSVEVRRWDDDAYGFIVM